MKLRKVELENVRSFLRPQTLSLDGDISIVIGPNGGGKTNLLDSALLAIRKFLLRSWTFVDAPTADNPLRREIRANDQLNENFPKHSAGKDQPQRVRLEIEVTPSDIASAKAMKAFYEANRKAIDAGYVGPTGLDISDNLLSPGTRLTYEIRDNGLVSPATAPAQAFLNFLVAFEAANGLLSDFGQSSLQTPVLSMPVNRSSGGFSNVVSLGGFNDGDQKRDVDAANSRRNGSITALAVGRLAKKYRILLEADSGNAKKEFNADPQVADLTAALSSLGYSWQLESTRILQNEYTVRLTKQGSSFLVDAASSGEKELLTYLFAIYALNVRDALVVIDEPELHLHPKWQTALMGLFETLSKNTGNQFLMATHSPVFVAPSSIQYVSRVFSKNQASEIVRLDQASLPNRKHLFSIVNSQNNEKVFFTSRVILVEGVGDRLFFQKLLKRYAAISETQFNDVEIVDVGGKHFFPAYQALLDACRVDWRLVADRDYLAQIGSDDVKGLVEIDAAKLKSGVEGISMDGTALVRALEDVAAGSSLENLGSLVSYLKNRHSRFKVELSGDDLAKIRAEVQRLRPSGTFVMQRGTLEDYLPAGMSGKNINALIEFLDKENFWDEIPHEAQTELTELCPLLFDGVGQTHNRGR
jgi:ABC-type lipoprotein export system ATPase subunit